MFFERGLKEANGWIAELWFHGDFGFDFGIHCASTFCMKQNHAQILTDPVL
jgi:hypothetical protein